MPAETLPRAAAAGGAEARPAPPAQRPEPSARVAWALVGLLTLGGLALRAAYVGDPSLGYEETFTASIAGRPSVGGMWDALRATESTPPLFYLLTWLWLKLSGAGGEGALRAVSLAAGTATIPAVFAAVRAVSRVPVALAAALLAAVSPELVGYAIYARSYALLVLVSVLSVWALAVLLRHPRRGPWIAWTLSAIACVWTHYFLGFLVLGEVLVLVAVLRRPRPLVMSLVAIAAACAPLASLFLGQRGDAQRTAFIGDLPLGDRLEGLVRQFAMGANVPSAWLEAAGIGLACAGVVAALALTRRARPTHRAVALALAAAGVPIVLAAAGIDDHFLPRNVLGAWILFCGVAAWGLSRLRAVPLALYAALCLVAVVLVQGDWRYQAAADWRGVATRLRAAAAGEPVAVLPGLQLPVAEHYLDRMAATAPVQADSLWVVVEPQRGPGQRALSPVADPALGALFGEALRPAGEIDHRGFRLVHLRAPAPVTLPPVVANPDPSRAPLAAVLAP